MCCDQGLFAALRAVQAAADTAAAAAAAPATAPVGAARKAASAVTSEPRREGPRQQEQEAGGLDEAFRTLGMGRLAAGRGRGRGQGWGQGAAGGAAAKQLAALARRVERHMRLEGLHPQVGALAPGEPAGLRGWEEGFLFS